MILLYVTQYVIIVIQTQIKFRLNRTQGTMSITEGINTFSTETVIASKVFGQNEDLLSDIEKESVFLQSI